MDGLKPSDWIQVAIFLAGGASFIFMMRGDLKMLARDVRAQGKAIEQLATIVKDQAVMNERLNAFDRQLEEFRHWRGFVNPSGEYRRDATPPVIFDR